ncbi:hypothetical protein POTOM_022439 [Populus tomentosa]|uniref:PQ-loop repeat family protein / transmembrane family protein n=1 Tax=Populus tomentosa TaxID=118781 RepID=A0A8X7ZRK1_POPTO|nr:hypothetical protein POTOM_022439 [Populus tomentosa]
MDFFKSTMPICPQHCSQWARVYMEYCLCNMKDGVSLTLGMISVLSWGAAEIPQIVTNYKEKSTEGLSLAFLLTWIIGDLFNVFGCMLEPATLPTQYYMAVLYTMTSTLLTAQTVYYGHIYHRLKCNRRRLKGPVSSHSEEAGRIKQGNSHAGAQVNSADKQRNEPAAPDGTNGLSSPIPFPTLPQKSSPERDLYYASARSLSSSHTPTVGSFLAQRMTPSFLIRNSIEEPFNSSKTSSIMSHENDIDGNAIGMFLGWSMAAIYMGGRLPQICLNIKRGKVEGLNPLMFVFALVGNITYVASILVDSLAWSKIRANLPWLVDAGGCVLLDTCVSLLTHNTASIRLLSLPEAPSSAK